jgi:hypothetical protein
MKITKSIIERPKTDRFEILFNFYWFSLFDFDFHILIILKSFLYEIFNDNFF